MRDLNGLVPAGSGWVLTEARAINDNGSIVGFGINPSGATHAFLLTPNVTAVTTRRVFYNNSAFDGNNPAANAADDAAVTTDKVALLPGGTATFANYTSYSKGINGIMIDFAGMPSAPLAAADFTFRVGNDSTPNDWAVGPAPSAVVMRALPVGANTSRVEIVWPDGAIRNTWLQVTVKANEKTGLAAADVFYFGNAVGESGNKPTDAKVTFADEAGARAHPGANVPVTNRWDYNRDRRVNVTDQLIARRNRTTATTALRLISPPVAAAVAPGVHRAAGRPALSARAPLIRFAAAGAAGGATQALEELR
jgi:probable HAF family extracellular repeat protein